MRPAAGRLSASRGRAARLLAAVCMSAGVLAGGAAGSPAIAATAGSPSWAGQCGAPALGLGKDTVQLAPVLGTDTLPGGGRIVPRPLSGGTWVPVIMVHGWTSQDTNTRARTGAFSHYIDLSDIPGFSPKVTRSLIGQLQRIRGAAVFTFDYHPYSARWVDDPHLGPALGKVIDCLYRASGQKVIIVAHSMGGLIARYAATRPGVTGKDRSGEISSVVTFGTPEAGSVAALLTAAGIDVGAAVSKELAVIRLILAACGKLATGDVKTGTLCDKLPPFVRAFASRSGIALRAGSSQLAALKPWPPKIRLTALAGNVTFEVPDPGWFSIPWASTATTPVDVGDMVVTRGSALAGATTTGNASCDYQLNAVRGAADQVSVWLGQAASSQVAQQPLGSVTGACFHTNLMRGIELTNDADTAVSADIASRCGAVSCQPKWAAVGKMAPGPIQSVSCTAQFCAAVGAAGTAGHSHGYALTYQAGAWSKPVPLGTGDKYAVSCPAATFCMAVTDTGYAYTLRAGTWSGPADIDPAANAQPSSADAIEDLSCATPAFCVAVSGMGKALTWNGTAWSPPRPIGLPGIAPPPFPGFFDQVSVSCPTPSYCLAGTGIDFTQAPSATWNGHGWTVTPQTPLKTTSWNVSCASPAFCMAAGGYHAVGDQSAVWDGAAWSGLARPPGEGDALAFNQVSCPRDGSCVAVDGGAFVNGSGSTRGSSVFTWSAGAWSGPQFTDTHGSLDAISCTPAGLCVAADSQGYLFINPQVSVSSAGGPPCTSPALTRVLDARVNQPGGLKVLPPGQNQSMCQGYKQPMPIALLKSLMREAGYLR